jgi:hypothetical protein
MNSLESLPVPDSAGLLEIDAFQNQPLVRRSGKIAPGAGTVQQALRVWHCPEPVRNEVSNVITGKTFASTGKTFAVASKTFAPRGKTFASTGRTFAPRGKTFAPTGRIPAATSESFVFQPF